MLKQIIVVRTSYPDGRGGVFKPRTGKIAAQVAHASLKVFLDKGDDRSVARVKQLNANSPITEVNLLTLSLTPEMIEWAYNGEYAKIVLGVDSEDDLLAIHKAALAAKLPTALIKDLAHTEFKEPTFTACAVGPAQAEEIDKITKDGPVKTRLI